MHVDWHGARAIRSTASHGLTGDGRADRQDQASFHRPTRQPLLNLCAASSGPFAHQRPVLPPTSLPLAQALCCRVVIGLQRPTHPPKPSTCPLPPQTVISRLHYCTQATVARNAKLFITLAIARSLDPLLRPSTHRLPPTTHQFKPLRPVRARGNTACYASSSPTAPIPNNCCYGCMILSRV